MGTAADLSSEGRVWHLNEEPHTVAVLLASAATQLRGTSVGPRADLSVEGPRIVAVASGAPVCAEVYRRVIARARLAHANPTCLARKSLIALLPALTAL